MNNVQNQYVYTTENNNRRAFLVDIRLSTFSEISIIGYIRDQQERRFTVFTDEQKNAFVTRTKDYFGESFQLMLTDKELSEIQIILAEKGLPRIQKTGLSYKQAGEFIWIGYSSPYGKDLSK